MTGRVEVSGRPEQQRWEHWFRSVRQGMPTWATEAPWRLCYLTNASGVWQVVAHDLRSDTSTQISGDPAGASRGVLDATGTRVLWFRAPGGGELGQHVATPFGGGAPVALFPSLGRGWARGLSAAGRVVAAGLATPGGHAVVVEQDGQERVLLRAEHPLAVGDLSADGSLLAVRTRAGHDAGTSVRVVCVRSGALQAEAASDGRPARPGPWSPGSERPRLVLHLGSADEQVAHLLDPASGRLYRVGHDVPGSVQVADWFPCGERLLLHSSHRGRSRLHVHDLADSVTTPLPVQAGTVHDARVRPDGALWCSVSSGAVSRRTVVLGSHRSPTALAAAVRPSGAAYLSYDYTGPGGRVPAFLACPGTPAPHPLVVAVHGGPRDHVRDAHDPEVQAWVARGYAVLMPNYRGSTGYGRAWQEAADADPGFAEVADLRAGVECLVRDGLVDRDRLVLHGASWGGYLALLAAGTQPDLWSVVVAVAPVGDLVAAYEDGTPALRQADRWRFGGSPQEAAEAWARRSPVTRVRAVRAAVLVVSGREDPRCPLRQVQRYVEALASVGVRHRLVVQDEVGHQIRSDDVAVERQRLAMDFVEAHLPVAARSGSPRP